MSAPAPGRSWPRTRRRATSPGCRGGITGWASTASSACRPPTTAPSSPRAPSRPTPQRTCVPWAAGPTRSARTSCYLDDARLPRHRAVRARRARLHGRARTTRRPHEPTLALGPRDVRGATHTPAPETAPRAGEARRRHRLPGALPRHRNRLLLGAGRDPVPLRLPLDRRLVVDTADPDHAGDLRIPAPMAGTATSSADSTSTPQRDARGFIGYLFIYQVLTSAAALRGYGQYITGTARRWK